MIKRAKGKSKRREKVNENKNEEYATKKEGKESCMNIKLYNPQGSYNMPI